MKIRSKYTFSLLILAALFCYGIFPDKGSTSNSVQSPNKVELGPLLSIQVNTSTSQDLTLGEYHPSANPKHIQHQREMDSRVTKILILSSNARSGSSYLADLLTPMETNPFYVFEPLRWLYQQVPGNNKPAANHFARTNLTPSKSQLNKHSRIPIGIGLGSMITPTKASVENESLLVDGKDKIALLDNIFQCSLSSLETWWRSDVARHYSFRKPLRGLGIKKMTQSLESMNVLDKTSQRCKNAHIRLVKCIRLRLSEVALAMNNDKNGHLEGLTGTKIILLVRDPRAVLTSMLFAPDKWGQRFRNASHVCMNILQDLEAWEKLRHDNNVLLIKYEDLATTPRKVISMIARFFGTPQLRTLFITEIQKHILDPHKSRIFRHRYSNVGKRLWSSPQEVMTSKNKAIIGGTWRFYGTIRENDFEYDGWRKKIPEALLHEINTMPECQLVFTRLNYVPYSS